MVKFHLLKILIVNINKNIDKILTMNFNKNLIKRF